MSPYPSTPRPPLTPKRQPWRAGVGGLTAPVIPQMLRLSPPVMRELTRSVKPSGNSLRAGSCRGPRRTDRRLLTVGRSRSTTTLINR